MQASIVLKVVKLKKESFQTDWARRLLTSSPEAETEDSGEDLFISMAEVTDMPKSLDIVLL